MDGRIDETDRQTIDRRMEGVGRGGPEPVRGTPGDVPAHGRAAAVRPAEAEGLRGEQNAEETCGQVLAEESPAADRCA